MDYRLLRLRLNDALSALADLLMSRVCLVCGRELNLRERFLCLPCSMDLPLTRYENWEHNPMADKYNLRINQSLSGSSFSVSLDPVTVTPNLVAVTPDTPLDVTPDTSLDVTPDTSSNVSPDTPLNVTPDTPLNVSPDTPLDVSPDTSLNVTPDQIGGPGCPVAAGYDTCQPYQRAAALFFYRRGSGYDLITQSLKYGRNFEAGRHFAAMLGRLLRESPLFSDVDLVVPVPLHWTRRLRRGYNQAEVIAREVARELGRGGAAGGPGDRPAGAGKLGDNGSFPEGARRVVAFAPRLLRRVRHTKTQTRVSSGNDSSSDSSLEARARNVSGAFAVQRVYTLTVSGEGMFKKGPKTHIPSTVSSRVCTEDKQKGISPQEIHHILLVDDVCTTASTLASCHSALRTVFGPGVRISIATLAFAE